MQQLKTLEVGGASVELTFFRGEVVGLATGLSTEVRGRGDATYIQISSATTERKQFFLKNAAGHEQDVRVVGELALRDGHDVTVIWGMRQGDGEATCVAVVNHTTRKTTLRPEALQHLAFGEAKDRSIQGCLGLVVSAWMVLMGVALIGGGLSLLGESGLGGAALGLPLAAAGVALVLFGWKRIRGPRKERDRRLAVFSKFESEIKAVVAQAAAD